VFFIQTEDIIVNGILLQVSKKQIMKVFSQDLVILIDENNQVIGHMDKNQAHKNKGSLHRAISVFLFNDKGQLLIQKRSEQKIVAAGLWANTVCGNVRPGETHLDCAKRRLKEELNLENIELKKVGVVRYFYQFNNGYSENERDEIYVGKIVGKPVINTDEVGDIKAISWEELLKQCDNGNKYAPWLKIIVNNPDIVKNINEFLDDLKDEKNF